MLTVDRTTETVPTAIGLGIKRPFIVVIVESDLVWMGCGSVNVDSNFPLIILITKDNPLHTCVTFV